MNKSKLLISLEDIKGDSHKVFDKYLEVSFAYLFGSYAKNQLSSISDIDIAVYLKEERRDLFLQIYIDLCRAMGRDKIDLLIIIRNLILLDSIIREGLVIYDMDPSERERFEIKIQHLALDFRIQRVLMMGI